VAGMARGGTMEASMGKEVTMTRQAMLIRQMCQEHPVSRFGTLTFRLVFNGMVADPGGANKIFVITILPTDNPLGVTSFLGEPSAIGEKGKDYTVIDEAIDIPQDYLDKAIAVWKSRELCRQTFSKLSNVLFSDFRDDGYLSSVCSETSEASPKNVELTISDDGMEIWHNGHP